MKLGKVVLALSVTAMSANVMGAGYEKVVQWSARWSGVAGAATGAVGGADALYFNPAGLGRVNSTSQVSGNLTHSQSQFEGPVYDNNVELKSRTKSSTLPALLYSRKISDNFAIGAGYYVAGGTGADFGASQLGQVLLQPEQASEIAIVEYALGASYQISPELSIGAALRYAEASGMFAGGSVGNAKVKYTGLEDEETGFKAGLQYITSSWGLGFSYRSELGMSLEGDAESYVDTGAATGGILGTTRLESDFPYQMSLGGFFDVANNIRVYAEATFTEYSANERINVTTNQTFTFGGLADANALNNANADIEQEWDDQWNYRVGAEIMDGDLTYRAGYALTTQVTPDKRARPTFASPGPGHTFVAGVGKQWNNSHFLDGAIEYSRASGDNNDDTFRPIGDYNSGGISIHTSYTVNF